MRKPLVLILAALFLLFGLAACGGGANPASDFEYRYDAELGGMVITEYTGNSTKVRIPEKIEGKPVVAIGEPYYDSSFHGVFESCTKLKSVTMPNSVTHIGGDAFHGCKELTNINIPDNVTNIGYEAFAETAWLDAQPDGVVYAGKVAYTYKGEMAEGTSIVLLKGTTGIADYAFNPRRCLTAITIPDTVTSIGIGAFGGCAGLTNVTIPNSVTEIGGGAFYACRGLTSVNISNSVTSIGKQAFLDCSSLESVTIPNNVTFIGDEAFMSCSSQLQASYKGVTYNYDASENDLPRAFYNAVNGR